MEFWAICLNTSYLTPEHVLQAITLSCPCVLAQHWDVLPISGEFHAASNYGVFSLTLGPTAPPPSLAPAVPMSPGGITSSLAYSVLSAPPLVTLDIYLPGISLGDCFLYTGFAGGHLFI